MTNTNKIHAIVFDLDGVLLSTDYYHYLAWKELADELNIPFTEKDNEAFRGVSRMDCLELLLAKKTEVQLTAEEKKEYANIKNNRYRFFLQSLSPNSVSKEIRDTLFTLHNRGYRLAVGSSSKNTRFILDKTDLTGCFDAIADGNDITKSKPDPEVFLKAAKRINIQPSECAVIEDSEAGLLAAQRGGMLPVAYANAVNSPLAAISLTSFSALLNYFQNLKQENIE